MTSLLTCFKVKVTGQGQRQRSIFKRATVDIRGSALPSAAKSSRSRYQSSGVHLCVCNQWAYAGNCADAVDQLLICHVLATHLPGAQLFDSCLTVACQVLYAAWQVIVKHLTNQYQHMPSNLQAASSKWKSLDINDGVLQCIFIVVCYGTSFQRIK